MGARLPAMLLVSSGRVKSPEDAEREGFKRGSDVFREVEFVLGNKRRKDAEDARKQKETLLTGLGTNNEGNPRLG